MKHNEARQQIEQMVNRINCKERTRYEARWGKVYDVSNAKGRLDGTLIIKPNKARWGIYYIK